MRQKLRSALEARNADEAEQSCRALLELNAADIWALIGLGQAARLRGRHGEALAHFQAAATAHPRNTWPLLEIGAEYCALDQPAEAEAALRQALEINPIEYHCLLSLARMMRDRGDNLAAADLYRTAATNHPTQAAPVTALAALLARTGKPADGLDVLERGLAAGAPAAILLPTKARLLRGAGQHAAALQAWTQALADNPEDVALKLEIAAETAALDDTAAAFVAYQAVIDDVRIAPDGRRDVALAASRLARAQNQTAQALTLLEQARTLDPEHAETTQALADLHRATGRLREAEDFYQAAHRLRPTSLGTLGGLAIVQRQLGKPEEALALLGQAAEVDPKNDWVQFEIAITLRDQGRGDEAAAILELIDPASSMYYWARMTLGRIARARGARQEAAAYFEEASLRAPDPTEPLAEIAAERRACGDLPGAEEAIARIFAHTPDSARGHLANGHLRRALGDSVGALDAFRRATEVDPGRPQAHVERAMELRARGDLPASLAALDTALQLDPRHESALLNRATCLTDLGDTDGALEIYAQLREDRPASIWAYLGAAHLLVEQGDVDAGLAILETARQACPANVHIDLRRAEILRRAGLHDAALEVVQDVYARHTQELTPWCHLASMYITLGRFTDAVTMLANPPQAVGAERARVLKIQAQYTKARWDLEAAIADLSEVCAVNPRDPYAVYERAKLKLITFDIEGAREDLLRQAELRQGAARREGRSPHKSQSHVGQLFEEFSVDRELLNELSKVRGIPAERQIEAFVRLVNAYPDSTAPAIGLMIALRRAGYLDPRPKESGSTPTIPRILTQFWNDPQPPGDVRDLMNSWTEAEPDFQIEVFDDVRAQNYLSDRCDARVSRAFSMAAEPAQRADIFRLARLSVDGGFFVDADDRARGGLTAYAPGGVGFFAHQEDLGSIGDNVIGAQPDHPIIQLALDDAVTAVIRDDRDLVWLSTGPGLLTRAAARWLCAEPSLLIPRLQSVAIVTLAEMGCVAAMYCHAAYKMTPRAWLNRAFPKRRRRG